MSYKQESYNRDMFGFSIDLAKWLHRGQVDKSGEPYFDHPWRVMNTLALQDAPYEWQAAAMLHDVTEDTTARLWTLREVGIPEEVIEIVRLLDRNDSKVSWNSAVMWSSPEEGVDETLGATNAEEYYYFAIRENPGALAVKLADIADNMLEWRLERLDAKTQKRLRAKYARGLELLNG
jgi:(p)ppGpp synthase/HD superfamily hydrolase